MSIIGNPIRIIQRKVPLGYREVEYIESHGLEYIDTGIALNSIGRGWLKFIVTTAELGYMRIFGGEESSNTDGFYITPYGGDALPGSFQFVYNRQFDGFTSSLNTMFEAEFIFSGSTAKYVLNGSEISKSISGVVTSLSAFLFTLRRANAPHANKIKARMYEFMLWDFNGDLVQNLIPCYRQSDNEVGMWDLVSNTFLTNSGTGAFTAGPVV